MAGAGSPAAVATMVAVGPAYVGSYKSSMAQYQTHDLFTHAFLTAHRASPAPQRTQPIFV
jgi:hypothetical protein